MLKLASNFEMLIYFFVFCWIEKKDEFLCNFCNEITHSPYISTVIYRVTLVQDPVLALNAMKGYETIQPFLDLEGVPKLISQQH